MSHALSRFIFLALFLFFSLKAESKQKENLEPNKPLYETSFQEIMKRYTFVDDFTIKDAERNISEELFWRYPLKMERSQFNVYPDFDDLALEFPASKGESRAIEHLNKGRVLFLEGKYEEARKIWLSARARYGKNYPYHRRADYFIGYAYLKLAIELKNQPGRGWNDRQVRGLMSNASTFLSWAFVVKKDEKDEVTDYAMPKGLYNLAAIYYMYDRFQGALTVAESGLNFLRVSGRKDFRSNLRRIIAEVLIRSRDYLGAVQEIDTGIRQDPEPSLVATMFARVGDIYFDLNNYELAEDIYGLGARIDEEMREINPEQLVFRGESLFWLGRFAEAQKVLLFSLEGQPLRKMKKQVSLDLSGYAMLRFADAFLARGMFNEAKMAYFKVWHEFRETPAAKIANVRRACLELPYYQGNNIAHAREILEEVKTSNKDLPRQGNELAWACQVASYAQHERTTAMVERVRAFANEYPESRFLKSLAEPVREVQAEKIEAFFSTNDIYSAISFFEKNRKALFPGMPKKNKKLSEKLFAAYMDTFKPEAAKEFWPAYHDLPATDLKLIRETAFFAEIADGSKTPKKDIKKWNAKSIEMAKKLSKHAWTIAMDPLPDRYIARIMSTSATKYHLGWIYKLAYMWGGKNSDSVCSFVYPILSRWFQSGDVTSFSTTLGSNRKVGLDVHVKRLIDEQFPGLLSKNESCAGSILDLEAKILDQKYAEIGKRYLARKEWPMQGAFLEHYWTIAEISESRGDKVLARSLWQVISDKAPKESAEFNFARNRLDPKKTEFESLWE